MKEGGSNETGSHTKRTRILPLGWSNPAPGLIDASDYKRTSSRYFFSNASPMSGMKISRMPLMKQRMMTTPLIPLMTATRFPKGSIGKMSAMFPGMLAKHCLNPFRPSNLPIRTNYWVFLAPLPGPTRPRCPMRLSKT